MDDSMSSQQAVGSIETKGFPAVLAAADKSEQLAKL